MPLRALSVVLLCVIISSRASLDNEVRPLLEVAKARINATEAPHCFNGPSGTKTSYLKSKYSAHLTGGGSVENTIVYPFCLMTRELGNKLGNLFTEIGCAEAAGLHFIAVHKQWDLSGSHTNITSTASVTTSTSTVKAHKDHEHQKRVYSEVQQRSKRAFLEALPDVIVHPRPVQSREQGLKNVQERCKCSRYCWGERQSAWINHTASISKYLRTAITAYRTTSGMDKVGTILSVDTDITNAQPNQFLPVVPDVALQYRCGDNIGFSYMYGVLPFHTFLSRIPAHTRLIYVLSDHPSRAVHSPYSGRCQVILHHLFEYLKLHFPQATIAVKRGGDMFLDYVRLAFANTTICSASTYCFWPALANTEGHVHFPLSGVIAGADTLQQAPDFGSRFHWISDAQVISDFRKYRPWTNVLDVLEGKDPASLAVAGGGIK